MMKGMVSATEGEKIKPVEDDWVERIRRSVTIPYIWYLIFTTFVRSFLVIWHSLNLLATAIIRDIISVLSI